METTAYPDTPPGTIGVHSPRGNAAILHFREGTSDLSTIGSTFRLWSELHDEYELAGLTLGKGDVFVDIGAHIGTVGIAVLIDNPEAVGIAVEPLSENVDVLRASAASAGVADRLTILTAAIGAGSEATIAYDFEGSDYLHNHRYIGGMDLGESGARMRTTVPTVTIARLVKMAGGRIAAMKFDCEGCEWLALRERAIRHVALVFGEWHGHAIDQRDGLSEVTGILAKTHDVSLISNQGGTGVFRAVRR